MGCSASADAGGRESQTPTAPMPRVRVPHVNANIEGSDPTRGRVVIRVDSIGKVPIPQGVPTPQLIPDSRSNPLSSNRDDKSGLMFSQCNQSTEGLPRRTSVAIASSPMVERHRPAPKKHQDSSMEVSVDPIINSPHPSCFNVSQHSCATAAAREEGSVFAHAASQCSTRDDSVAIPSHQSIESRVASFVWSSLPSSTTESRQETAAIAQENTP